MREALDVLDGPVTVKREGLGVLDGPVTVRREAPDMRRVIGHLKPVVGRRLSSGFETKNSCVQGLGRTHGVKIFA